MKYTKLALLLLPIALVAVFSKACGSRVRSADLQISRSEVDSSLQAIYSNMKTTSVSNDISMMESFLALAQASESSIYYTDAPGTLGDIENVMPIFWQDLLYSGSKLSGAVTKAWAYFVTVPTDQGWRGGLVIAIKESGTSQTQQPIPGASPSPSTGSSSDTPTAVMVFLNDGKTTFPGTQTPVYPGNLDAEEFGMEMARQKDVHLVLRSTDIYEEDLTDVIQLELSTVRYNEEVFTGLLNMVQPN